MCKKLLNVYLPIEQGEFISVNGYKIFSTQGCGMSSENFRQHTVSGYVQFSEKENDSILFSGGLRGEKEYLENRTMLEDVLVVGSILTGWNWWVSDWLEYNDAPLSPSPHLVNLELDDKNMVEDYFETILNSIQDANWQKQYDNGFHLRMLLNNANIHNAEARYLSNIVVWEWLYPHLNEDIAGSDYFRLKDVFNYILDHFWSDRGYKGSLIFPFLRNQLAHSGKLPIDRNKAEPWMKELEFCSPRGSNQLDLKYYMSFFDKLTQIVVLKAVGVNAEKKIFRNHDFDRFLRHGKLDQCDCEDCKLF